MSDLAPALTRFRNPAAFFEVAGPFLVDHEAEHCLPLGICAGLAEHSEELTPTSYLAVVEQAGAVAAVAICTPPHHLVLARTRTPEAIALIAADVCQVHPDLAGVLGPPGVSRAFADAWQRLTGRSARLSMAQRIYALTAVIPGAGVPGSLRPATEADRKLLVEWVRAFASEAFPDAIPGAAERMVDARLASPVAGFSFWEDAGPVSLVGYSGPTPHGIRIGPVYTPPAHRRKGYASAAVAAVSQLLLDGGRQFVCLFADLANPTSNRIYQAIGYRPVADVDDYQFGDAEAAGPT
ncbi:MAG: GNAT family N-acetyltransferase [Thermomicrobiales bacterium]